jgi:hypothetical protein
MLWAMTVKDSIVMDMIVWVMIRLDTIVKGMTSKDMTEKDMIAVATIHKVLTAMVTLVQISQTSVATLWAKN